MIHTVPSRSGKRQIFILISVVATLILFCYTQNWIQPWLWTTNYKATIDPMTSNWSSIEDQTSVTFIAWQLSDSSQYEYMRDHLFKQCLDLNCIVSMDKNSINEASAILFLFTDLKVWTGLPEFRNPNQYYIFVTWESADNYKRIDLESHKDFFNMTMTYRLDSTVPYPYGVFEKMTDQRSNNDSLTRADLNEIVRGKSKMLAWFVSNCETPSRREHFVYNLQEYLNVDVYGYCGKFKCPRENQSLHTGLAGANSCHRTLTRDYKFYLSLENSICRDYVTEKLYYIMESSIIVPIVMDRNLVLDTIPDLETAKMMNKSIIAVNDFEDVRGLSEYLLYLDRNITAYMEFHEWRFRGFQVHDDNFLNLSPGCQLCKLVKQKRKCVIPDIHEWWNEGGQCRAYNEAMRKDVGINNFPLGWFIILLFYIAQNFMQG